MGPRISGISGISGISAIAALASWRCRRMRDTRELLIEEHLFAGISTAAVWGCVHSSANKNPHCGTWRRGTATHGRPLCTKVIRSDTF